MVKHGRHIEKKKNKKENMIEGFIIGGIWFIGFCIIMVGFWLVEEFKHIESELDNIRLEFQYWSTRDKNSN